MAKKRFLGIFIHGIGSQDLQFADLARERLRRAMGAKGIECWFQSVRWADLPAARELAFQRAARAKGSDISPGQRVSNGAFADAFFYMNSAQLRGDINDRIQDKLEAFRERPGIPHTELVFFGHSLGALIAVDFLRTGGQRLRPRALVTMGANIGILRRGLPQLELPECLRPGGGTSWTNVTYKKDMLGYPLSIEPGLEHVKDVMLPRDARPITWTSLSHVAYWDSRKLWSDLVPWWFSP